MKNANNIYRLMSSCTEDHIEGIDNIEEDEDYSWIDVYNNKERDYDKYYKNEPTEINCFFIYVDKTSTVESFLVQKINLENRIVTKERLVTLINDHKIKNKYRFNKLLKYNITVSPEHIGKLTNKMLCADDFLTEEKTIHDIVIKDTITMLHSANALIFVYREKTDNITTLNKTKRIYKKMNKTKKISGSNKHT